MLTFPRHQQGPPEHSSFWHFHAHGQLGALGPIARKEEPDQHHIQQLVAHVCCCPADTRNGRISASVGMGLVWALHLATAPLHCTS